MPFRFVAASARAASSPGAQAERIVAWLRIPLIALIVLAATTLSLPGEVEGSTEAAFFATAALYVAWGVGILAYIYVRPVGYGLSIAAIAVDIAAITALAALSGGPFSEARRAYFIIPLVVAFRFRPIYTMTAAIAALLAFLIQALLHPAASHPEAGRVIAIQAGYLIWVGLTAALLSRVLAMRTRRMETLAADRRRLTAEVLSAEERERRDLAEGLHDKAIQNLLAARHDLQELSAQQAHPALRRADAAIEATVGELRDAVFELHPYVLDQAGLRAALTSVSERAAQRGNLRLHLDLRFAGRHPQEQLLFGVARGLLDNVVTHAHATDVWVSLGAEDDHLHLRIADNGVGFDPHQLEQQLASGHIGIASYRARMETAGGELGVLSSPGAGTTVEARLPVATDLSTTETRRDRRRSDGLSFTSPQGE